MVAQTLMVQQEFTDKETDAQTDGELYNSRIKRYKYKMQKNYMVALVTPC